MINRKSVLFAMVVVMLVLSLGCGLAMAQRRGATGPSAAAGPPPCTTEARRLTLTVLIILLQDSKTPVDCIVKKIKEQNIAFDVTPVIKQTLMDFSANAEILSALPAPPPPPPSPPKDAGPLTVSCGSPECDVYIGGIRRKTMGGTTEISGLRPGKVPLVVYKEGFRIYVDEIDLVEGSPKTLPRIQLQPIPPDPALPGLKVKSQLWDMAAATGSIESIDGSGTLSWSSTGETVEWKIPKFVKSAANELDITFKNAKGECKLVKVTVNGDKPPCAKLKDDPKTDVIAAAKLFLRYQVHDILGTLSRREFVSSNSQANTLQTVGGADSYVLTLTAAGLPSQLDHQFQDKHWTVQYLDYKAYGRGNYPMRMVIEDSGSGGKWEFQLSPAVPR